ncbi:endonuclease V [Candidatus Parcubacteria bacterium]|nr:endonuclease V [Candidatus Parcubacteria bacterium]
MEYSKHIELQKKLAKEVRIEPLKGEVRLVAGVDVSMERFGNTLYAGIIVLSYPELRVVEEVVAKSETDFPYIPGLLSFREIPALLECVKKLSYKPDVYIVDGQGIAHPRRLGIATHLGLILGTPTIGCAKSVLYGRRSGDNLVDPKTGEVIGRVLSTKKGSNPLIVSPGHLITLEESVEIVRSALKGYKLPEPTRRAHLLVNAFRKGIIKN